LLEGWLLEAVLRKTIQWKTALLEATLLWDSALLETI
jgi:hypothetical protein